MDFQFFDLTVILILLVSGLMAFARGFVRELASIIAFLFALMVTKYLLKWTQDIRAHIFPEAWPDWLVNAALVVISFIFVYAITAWLGSKFARLLYSVSGIGMLDRLVGLIFGFARGIAIILVFLVALGGVMEREAYPAWVTNSYSFDILESYAEELRKLIYTSE